MRRTFAEVLRQADIDVTVEYRSLCSMFFTNCFKSSFGSVCPYKEIAREFSNMDIRGIAVSITDFNEWHGFHFESFIKKSAGRLTVGTIAAFADSINRDFGIILGRLENDGHVDRRNAFQSLRVKYRISSA